jgi:peptidoglycan/xylan/chitin deacetylase (PgdA/CDA1 family)
MPRAGDAGHSLPWTCQLHLQNLVARGVSALGAPGRLRALASQLFGGFILAFHDLAGNRFRELVESLAPDEPVPLAELVDRVHRGLCTKGIFAITVDDGVGDTVRALSAVAQDRHWPISFLLPTGYLDAPGGMPFQWLRRILARVPPVRLELRSGLVDLSTQMARRRFERRVTACMYSQPPAAYAELIDELVSQAIVQGWLSREHDAPPAPISWEEVTTLAAHPAIRFESHGVTHVATTALPPDQLDRELRESQERIQVHTGRPCCHFAYPFGSPESIGPVAPRLVARYYDSALTMSRGRVRDRNPFLLPRIPLYEGDSAARARLKVLTA